MNNLTLKQLRYFDALARIGHFGRAAQECAISQPALSMQIKEMEETLGQSLIERGGRRIRLTGFGEDIVERVRAILHAVDDIGDFSRVAQGGLSGRLRIGLIPTIAPYLLPDFVSELSTLHPELDVRVRETTTSHLLRALSEGQLDCAILALPVSEPSLTEVPVFTENFVLIRGAGDVDKPVPDQDGLRQMRLLLLEEGHCFRDQALSFCRFQSTRPRELMEGSSLSTLVQMVGAGMGVTLLPEMAVPVETRAANVSVARFPDPQPARSIGLIWRKTSPLASELGKLAAILHRVGERSKPRG